MALSLLAGRGLLMTALLLTEFTRLVEAECGAGWYGSGPWDASYARNNTQCGSYSELGDSVVSVSQCKAKCAAKNVERTGSQDYAKICWAANLAVSPPPEPCSRLRSSNSEGKAPSSK